MTDQVASNPQDLERAFSTFNQLSTQLADSYSVLEAHLARLNAELANSERARHAQSSERARLASRLESILDALPAGVVVLDADGRVQQCNPAAEQLLGTPLLGEVWREIIERSFAPRSGDGHDVSLRSGRIVNISTSPLGGEPGQILLLTDVTKAHELQRKVSLHQRLRSMGEMAASLAHQIRTPLASALLYTSQLKRRDLDPDKRAALLDKIVSRMRHLESLVGNILIFARGGQVLSERFTTEELLEAVQRILDGYVEESEIAVECSNDAPRIELHGNRDLLLTSLQNLITNAVQAMQGRGRLRIALRNNRDGALEITVQDDGPGIPAQHQAQIFNPFYTTRAHGTGLGLAVVKAVVHAHRGTVRLDSVPGAGCTFVLTIPLDPARGTVDTPLQRSVALHGG